MFLLFYVFAVSFVLAVIVSYLRFSFCFCCPLLWLLPSFVVAAHFCGCGPLLWQPPFFVFALIVSCLRSSFVLAVLFLIVLFHHLPPSAVFRPIKPDRTGFGFRKRNGSQIIRPKLRKIMQKPHVFPKKESLFPDFPFLSPVPGRAFFCRPPAEFAPILALPPRHKEPPSLGRLVRKGRKRAKKRVEFSFNKI